MFLRMSTAGLLALGLLGALSLEPMKAQSVAQSVEIPAIGETEALQDAASAPQTANYSDKTISIDYPATWQIEVGEPGEVAITNVPPTPLELIETRLYQVEAPPGPLVEANIDSFIEEGAAVSRYRSITIDEQSALVIWLAERPGDLSSAIATFIGYGDETIFLFSRYSPENQTAEDAILKLHGSFSNLASGAELPEDRSEMRVAPEDEDPILPTEELPLQNEDFQI